MINFEKIRIRLMQDCQDDYILITKWLTDPIVLRYFDGRDKQYDINKIVAKYKPRITQLDNVIPCIFSYDNIDIGYIQYYELTENRKKEFNYDIKEVIYGIDIFIGEVNYWNRGIGSKVLRAMMGFLKNNIGVNRIIVDPQIQNKRALRCYETCGFIKIRLLPKHEMYEGTYKDCWLMEIRL